MTVAEEASTLKPQMEVTDGLDNEKEVLVTHSSTAAKIGTDYNFRRKIVWKNALGFLVLHLAALYGLYICAQSRVATIFWGLFVSYLSAEGVTIGSHRLYSHKSFKATFSLRLVLVILQTIAGQNCLYIWTRDHRQHHKFSDTDADPHNASRGFFFSHVGWLMSRKHPMVIEKGKTIDMSDLEADPIVMFQKKYYKTVYLIFAIVIPVMIPVYFWNETYFNSFFVSYMTRNILVLNATWLVNSAAHLYGTKPFDKYILPVESKLVSFITIGEGWHNYHHTFPWDYRAAELGSDFMLTTTIIDICAYFGLAYDLKTAPYKMIEQRSLRTGDDSHPVFAKQKIRWQNGERQLEDSLEYETEEEEKTLIKNENESNAKQRVVAAKG